MFKLFITLLCTVVALAIANELKIDVTFLPESCERKSQSGDHLWMHYTGSIDESSATGVKGKVFDSSVSRGTPFDFPLGGGRVIKGWDQGLTGMCEGEKRILTIPPELGYGSSGAGGDIPGGATLRFEVECVKIGSAGERPPEPNIFAEIDANADGVISYEEMESWFKEQRGGIEIPQGLWESEDKNADGVISWEEFGGPKGGNPPSFPEDEPSGEL
jgi:FK506-binding protein 14